MCLKRLRYEKEKFISFFNLSRFNNKVNKTVTLDLIISVKFSDCF